MAYEGDFPDKFLDDLGMPRGQYDTNVFKENLVEYRWRVAWLNHSSIGKKILERRLAKETKDAQLLAQQREAVILKEKKLLTNPIVLQITTLSKQLSVMKDAVSKACDKIKAIHIHSKKSKLLVNEVLSIRTRSNILAEQVKLNLSNTKKITRESIAWANTGNVEEINSCLIQIQNLHNSTSIVVDTCNLCLSEAELISTNINVLTTTAETERETIPLAIVTPTKGKRKKSSTNSIENETFNLTQMMLPANITSYERRAFLMSELAKMDTADAHIAG